MSKPSKILLWLSRIPKWFRKKPKQGFVDRGVYISADEFKEIINTQLGDILGKRYTTDKYAPHLPDTEFYLPSIKYTEHVIEKAGIHKLFKWVKQRFDCLLPDVPLIVKIEDKITVMSVQELCTIPDFSSDVFTLDDNGWTKINWVERRTSKKPVSVTKGPDGFVETTSDHKFLSQGNFKAISELGKRPDLRGISNFGFLRGNEFCNELAYAFGVFLAEGHVSLGETKTTSWSWQWHIDMGQLDCLERIKPVLEDYTGVEMEIVLYPSHRKGVVRGGCTASEDMYRLKTAGNYGDNKLLYALFRDKFYTNDEEKKVPDEILHANIHAAKEFIAGFLDGDGHKRSKYQRLAACKSRVAAFGLYLLARKTGTAVYFNYDNRKCGYPVIVIGNKNNLTRAQNIVYEENRGRNDVYDINTESGKFYAGGFLMHNCDDFAVVLKAEFAKDAYRNGIRRAPHALAIVWGKLPGPHAINLVINDDRIVRFVEPQSGKVFLPGKKQKEVWMIIG